MSLIDEERMSELADRMSDEAPEGVVEETAGEQDDSTVSGAETQTEAPEDKQDEVMVSSTESVEEEDNGHSVPYARFQKVIKARNGFQNKITELEAMVKDLQTAAKGSVEPQPAMGSNVQTADDGDDWLDKILSEDKSPDQYENLNSRVHQIEVQEQERMLQAELQTVSNEFPSVPRELLLQTVIQDPSANLMETAEKYSTFIAGIEEGAIARHTARPSAAPRPKQAGSTHSNTPTNRDANPAQMTKEQRYQALRRILNN